MAHLQVHRTVRLFLLVSSLLVVTDGSPTCALGRVGRRIKQLDASVEPKFTMDPDKKHVGAWRPPDPLPPCMDTAMNFSINGLEFKGTHLMHGLKHGPAPPHTLITVKASGVCGAFTAPSTIYLRANSSDIEVFRDIFMHHAFSFLDPILKAGPVHRIIDLGTNVGLSLVYWVNNFPSAKILGVEPQLGNFGMASLNVAHRPNVFLERAAVTDSLGMGSLKFAGRGDWGWGAERTQSVTDPESFTSVTIPYLMDKYGWDKIDLLKVDIEGSELGICQDLERGATWIQNVRCITFEYHDRFFTGLKKSIQETCNAAARNAGMTFQGHYRIDDLFVWCRLPPSSTPVKAATNDNQRRAKWTDFLKGV